MVQYFIIINCQFIQIVNGYMCLQWKWIASKPTIQHTLSIHYTTQRIISWQI